MNIEPSIYQKAILEEIDSWDNNNLFVKAVAGSGKTTTLQMISEKLNGNTMFLAFNKHIANELKIKLPENIRIATINSAGCQILYANLNKNEQLKLENWKLKLIISEELDKILNTNTLLREKYNDEEIIILKENIKTLCDLIRVTYTTYEGTDEWIQYIINKYDIFDDCIEGVPFNIYKFVRKCIAKDIELFEKERRIDFIDQVFLPVKLNLFVPIYLQKLDNILVDEAQDLNKCTEFLIKKLGNEYTRYIFVGDEAQAIYGFNGSNANAIKNIIKNYNCKLMPLSVCYRCPKKHISLAKQIVPIIEHSKNAIDGEIYFSENKDIADLVQNGDMVLARKNKELSKIIIEILKKNKTVYIKDTELLIRTENLIKKFKCNNVTSLKTKLNKYEKTIKEKHKKAEEKGVEDESIEFSNNTLDLYNTTQVLLDWYIETNGTTHSKEEFISYLKQSFSSGNTKNSIVVSSIHCAKGAEANNIFLVNANLYPYYELARGNKEQIIEETNLFYVALTRAKEKLYLCTENINQKININNLSKTLDTNKNIC